MAKQSDYSKLLRDPKWLSKRIDILQRDNLTCCLCGDKEMELQVHHKEYKYGNKPWEYEDSNFQTLCAGCHCVIGSFKDKNLIPIIAAKYYLKRIKVYVINTIFQSPDFGLVLAINYYCYEEKKTELVTMIEADEFKGLDELFLHAKKLIA